ncbi:transporter substrate-binding domain-containing protein [Enterovibrio sp. ZSDZ35]|uniref:Transporter substrate-binding domain-containing protein n=1 Tax=Enterovibrio qingdaonensis TaxID=2899818 RepID=A0ABT5QSB6_9GAMM|nr:transporter substrate-binding domain-containing protein [Enterovibrio sp. ZSDZ35]MDD1783857.1 transporter substrate-binding domain-containing protein [Enterovibrio sp. ZSDZ35]
MIGLWTISPTARPFSLQESVQQRGHLTVCASRDALPLSGEDSPKGAFIEIAEAVAEAWHVSLTVEWVWARYQIRKSDCQLILGVARAKSPETHARYAPALLEHNLVWVQAVQNSFEIGFLPDNLQVAVASGSAAHRKMLEHLTNSQLRVGFGNEQDMLSAVMAGDVDMAIVSNLSFAWFIHQFVNNKKRLRASPFPDAKQAISYPMTIGIRRADSLDESDVREVLKALEENGVLTKILSEYGLTLSSRFSDPDASLDRQYQEPVGTSPRYNIITGQ